MHEILFHYGIQAFNDPKVCLAASNCNEFWIQQKKKNKTEYTKLDVKSHTFRRVISHYRHWTTVIVMAINFVFEYSLLKEFKLIPCKCIQIKRGIDAVKLIL